jgi:long-chain acyl-CoA synthetase
VRAFALGLAELGFERGDRLAVIGDNGPRLYQAMMAAQCLGGVPTALHPDAGPEEARDALVRAGARTVLAGDQEQVDKLLTVLPALPRVRDVVYGDAKGMRAYETQGLVSFEDVQERGRRFDADHPDFFEAAVDAGGPDDVALLAFTAGATGPPKAVRLTHRALFATGDALASRDGWRDGDEELLAYQPLAMTGEAVVSLFLAVARRLTVNVPESPETVPRDLREVGPTVFFGPPRAWENLLRDVQVRMEDSGRLARATYDRAMRVALDVESRRRLGEPVPAMLRLRRRIHEALVYGPIRDQLGLRRVRHAYVAGAPIGSESLRTLRALGLPVEQCYGLTECSALAVVQPAAGAIPGTAGTPLPGVEVRLSDEDEILVRSPGAFCGYDGDDAQTAGALVADGWVRTGDTGLLDEQGHLVVVGRAEDTTKLDDGPQFAPALVEQTLTYSPYIHEAVAVGAGRPYVSAMLTLDIGAVGRWAARQGLTSTGYGDLAHRPEVHDLLEEEVRRANERLPAHLAVARFVVLHRELSPEDGELTRTRALRRRAIHERYAPLIEALYDESASAPADAAGIEAGQPGAPEVRVRRVAPVAVGAEAAVLGGAR